MQAYPLTCCDVPGWFEREGDRLYAVRLVVTHPGRIPVTTTTEPDSHCDAATGDREVHVRPGLHDGPGRVVFSLNVFGGTGFANEPTFVALPGGAFNVIVSRPPMPTTVSGLRCR